MRRTYLFGAFMCPLVMGCSSESADEPENTSTVSQKQEVAFQALELTSTAALALLGPLADDAGKLEAAHPDSTPDGPVGLTPDEENQVKSGIEASGPASCAQFQWNAGLSATVDFDQCDFGANGIIIDGQLTVTITLAPTTIRGDFSQLGIGGTVFDGYAALSVTGTEAAPQTTISADVTLALASGATSVSLTNAIIQSTPSGTTLNGGGALASGTFSGSGIARDAHVVTGDCHASSGEADLLLTGAPSMTVIFLSNTPADGKVDVLIGGTKIAGYPLLQPCS